MPEHIHVLIYPRRKDYSISAILQYVKQSGARRILKYCRANGLAALSKMETGKARPKYRFCQDGRGYDRNYFSPDRIRTQIEYIHNNPVRRGLVESAVEWEWSSASFWLTGGHSHVTICSENLKI
jgi:putative transposase